MPLCGYRGGYNQPKTDHSSNSGELTYAMLRVNFPPLVSSWTSRLPDSTPYRMILPVWLPDAIERESGENAIVHASTDSTAITTSAVQSITMTIYYNNNNIIINTTNNKHRLQYQITLTDMYTHEAISVLYHNWQCCICCWWLSTPTVWTHSKKSSRQLLVDSLQITTQNSPH